MIEGSARAQTVAIAVDKNKNSQVALKWALENVVSKGQVIFLVHVKTKHSCKSNGVSSSAN